MLCCWGAVMFYRFIARQGSPASEFLKTQLWPLASRPALISSERFYPASAEFTTSAPFCTPPVFPAGWIVEMWRWQKRGIALSPHTRACKLYEGRGGGQIDGGAPLAWLGLTSG